MQCSTSSASEWTPTDDKGEYSDNAPARRSCGIPRGVTVWLDLGAFDVRRCRQVIRYCGIWHDRVIARLSAGIM
jgi:hypothetical protein